MMQSDVQKRLAWLKPELVTEVLVSGLEDKSLERMLADQVTLDSIEEVKGSEGRILIEQEQGGRICCKLSNYTICFTGLKEHPLSFLDQAESVHAVFFEKVATDQWVMHLFEFESIVTWNRWQRIKERFQGGMLQGLALAGLLGIDQASLQTVVCYTACQVDQLSSTTSSDPVLRKGSVGKKGPAENCLDWNQGQIALCGQMVQHRSVFLDQKTGYGEVMV